MMSSFSTRKENSLHSKAEDRAEQSHAGAATCQQTFQGCPPAASGEARIGIVCGAGAGTNNAFHQPGHAVDDAVNVSTGIPLVILDVVVAEDRRPSHQGAERATSNREKDHDD